jgi:flagellar basal body-associated protein FliL
MKRIEARPIKKIVILYRILIGVVVALTALILGGTVYALLARPAPPVPSARLVPGGEERIFNGIGRIRTSTAGPRPAAVILSVAFPYNPEDRPFSEELTARLGGLRRITADYFTAYSAEEIRGQDESALKAELLSRYNALLRLGSIDVLYFDDYMIID